MTAPILHDAWIDRARAVAVEDELARRGHHLKRQGQELVGPCPLCGGTDRFGVHLIRQIWNCRGCNVGGDVISLVRHLDGCSFGAATETLIGAHRQLPVIAQKRATKPSRIEPATSTEAALRLWDEARPIPGTLAARYLAHRGISDLPPEHEEELFTRYRPQRLVAPPMLWVHHVTFTPPPVQPDGRAIVIVYVESGPAGLCAEPVVTLEAQYTLPSSGDGSRFLVGAGPRYPLRLQSRLRI